MNAQQWERAKDIFEAALQVSQAERLSYVTKACEDDHDLVDEIVLLLEADANAGSFLDEPALAGDGVFVDNTSSLSSLFHLIPAGEVICGRFEIKRFLGQGGMGQVYEAEDIELGVTVALKTLRPEISSNEYALARFKKEVQLTRRVTHPNVCRVFDIGKHMPTPDGIFKSSRPFAFLTMEMLEGYTLAELLRQKKQLSTQECLPIAEQVADGLTAAHRVGIVHRDVKPSNILLVSGSANIRAVVTDFGLARTITPHQTKLLSESKSLTAHGHAVGTLAYMAPEQLTGAEVTPATDVYAFGLVLYEAVTGVKPWDPSLPFGGVAQRLSGPPPSPRTYVSDLPASWDEAIQRCLQVDPKDRFATPQSVVRQICSSTSEDSKSLIDSRRKFKSTKGKPSRLSIIAILLLPMMVIGWMGFRFYRSRMTVPIGSSMLVTEIENNTSDPELSAISELLRRQVGQSHQLGVVERDEVQKVLKEMGKPYRQDLDPSVAREVAWRAGSPAVVYGSVSKVGPGFSLDLRVDRISSPTEVKTSRSKSFSASDKQDLLRAIQDGSAWIRQTLGETELATVSNRPPEDTTTNSWEALSLYAQAERLKAIEHTDEAVRKLQEAVRVDPGFALAYMRLGDLSDYLGNQNQGIKYWREALSVMKPNSLTEREQLRIRGLYAADTGDYKKARGYFQSWEVLYPRDYLPSFYLAGTLISEGRYAEAIDKLNEAEKKQPSAWYIVARRARCRIAMGQLAGINDDLVRLRQLSQWETATMLQGSLAFLKGDYDIASTKFDDLTGSEQQEWKSLRYSLKASFLAERGERALAISELAEGVSFDLKNADRSSAADKQISLAYLYFRQLDFANCRLFAQSAVENESGVTHLEASATLLARCEAPLEAERLLHILHSSGPEPVFEIARGRVEGEILLAKNKPEEAVEKFRAAAVLQDAGAPKEYLARALTQAGSEAGAQEFKKIADAPGQIWQEPELQWPGLVGDSMEQYIHLTSRNDEICGRYTKLRASPEYSTLCSVH